MSKFKHYVVKDPIDNTEGYVSACSFEHAHIQACVLGQQLTGGWEPDTNLDSCDVCVLTEDE